MYIIHLLINIMKIKIIYKNKNTEINNMESNIKNNSYNIDNGDLNMNLSNDLIQNEIKDGININNINNNINDNKQKNSKIKQNEENIENEIYNESKDNEIPDFNFTSSQNENKSNTNDKNINNSIHKVYESEDLDKKEKESQNKKNNNEKSKEYDFDIDDEENELILNKNNITNKENMYNKNNKVDINNENYNDLDNCKKDINSNNIEENKDNKDENNNEIEIVFNYNNIKNESKDNERKINNNNIIHYNDKIENNHNNDENEKHSLNSKLEEKILFNSDDKSDYNKYIESPFNTPVKTEKNNEEIINIIKNPKKEIKKLSLEQIEILKENYPNLNIGINDDQPIKNYLKYYALDNNNKNNCFYKILFCNRKNAKGRKYSISLGSYLSILFKMNKKSMPISNIKYESLIKKLINLTNIHKKSIENEINNNIIVNEDKKEVLNMLFQNFKEKIKDLRNSYVIFLKNKKNCSNNLSNLKNAEGEDNIQQKREEMKNIYKDLIRYINTIYKYIPDKKRDSYQKVISFLKGYEKIEDENNKKGRKSLNDEEIKISYKTKDNNLKKQFLIGTVLIPLFYLINFFYSNFK